MYDDASTRRCFANVYPPLHEEAGHRHPQSERCAVLVTCIYTTTHTHQHIHNMIFIYMCFCLFLTALLACLPALYVCKTKEKSAMLMDTRKTTKLLCRVKPPRGHMRAHTEVLLTCIWSFKPLLHLQHSVTRRCCCLYSRAELTGHLLHWQQGVHRRCVSIS
jgi:hypothetical protein